jgi:sigma-B regulation protein RsbU (phosphoserine phosphatase)
MILLYNYYISRKLILTNVKENTKNLTSSAINKSEGFFRVIEKITKNISYLICDNDKSENEIKNILSNIVKNNDEICGSCLAYEPYKFKSGIEYFAPYFYKKADTLLYKNLAEDEYNYPAWGWYHNPIEKCKPLWSEPYFDKGGGNELMTTYSVPFYRPNGKTDSLIGVITADVSLKWLQEVVSQVKIFETGFAFLISETGTIITYPDTNYVMKESIFSLAEKFKDPDLKKVGEEMIAGHEDFVPISSALFKGKSWVYYTHLKNNNWSLGFVFPENELYADLYKLNQTLILMAAIGLALLLILIIVISNRVTRPLHALAMIAEGFGTGNFDIDIPPSQSSDEVGSLNKSFVRMQTALKKYVENLKLTTSAKEKIESELKIAREIQMGMIPGKFPAFPGRKEFDIYGFIEPAKEVGGDLYDFFFIDDDRLCFAIGDVSGKGTPAALFMAVTTTILRAEGQIVGLNTSSIIERMNTYLCNNNEGNLFVTLFLGILNVPTGEVEYVNAGHNKPFVIKSNGVVSELDTSHCIPLGINLNLSHTTNTFKLEKGDTIFLYTDGVSEAFNIHDQQYSIKKISELLLNLVNHAPIELIHHIVGDVKAFSQGTEQSDDISVLAIQYYGKQLLKTSPPDYQLVIKNSITNLSSISENITQLCNNWKLTTEVCNRVNLVVEELISNTIFYGYTDTLEHDIILNLMCDKDTISIEIIDDAKEFNPVEQPSTGTNSAITEREIGGMGIHLVKNLTDSFTYHRIGNQNSIKIEIHFNKKQS